MPAAALDTVARFPTPEHGAYAFRLAGPMVRLVAWIIDLLFRGAVLLVLLLALAIAGREAGLGIWLLAWFLADWLLGAWCEWRWLGRTPGKKAVGIRVVGVDGLPAGIGACLLRNVLRTADVLPTAATALAAMLLGERFQRLGDYAAGTLVVHDDQGGPARVAAPDDAAAKVLARQLPPETAAAVDGPTLRAIAAYVARRRRHHPARRTELAAPLATALAHRLGLRPDTDPDRLLCAVHLALSGEDAGAERSAAARAVAHADRRKGAWTRLDGFLGGDRNALRFRPGDRAEDSPPARFAALYRAACADLALADAYHLPERTVGFLHGLVARAHLRFHRTVAIAWPQLRRLVWREVPGRLYGDWCLRAAAAAFFGTFLLAALWAAWRPETAAGLLGPGMVDDLRDMYAEAPRGRHPGAAGFMTGFYIHHNVGIALSCFASGIFLGVGSLVWLAANGVFLGLCFGYMATGVDSATSAHFFEFVSAHGPFELTGIMLAGAAGLRLGLGVVATRGLSRAAGLRAAAAEAVPILAVAAVLVAAAAPIEGFVSPSSLPLWCKRTVMAACATALVVYLAVLGRKARHGP